MDEKKSGTEKVVNLEKFRLKVQEIPEAKEQCMLVEYLRLRGVRFTASANGGKRDIITAAQLKRQGVSAGFPDLTIPYARKGHHGLYIELKRRSGGVLSGEQQRWIRFLNEQGYLAVVCNGFDEARKVIEEYFDAK
jgi:hypothetical protein